jgi:hypothetical protein
MGGGPGSVKEGMTVLFSSLLLHPIKLINPITKNATAVIYGPFSLKIFIQHPTI